VIILVVAIVVGVPALGFALWPLVRPGGAGRAFLALSPDTREPLLEEKRSVLRALREIEFEHEAGHVSAADYGELRSRYEAEAAAILTALDRLGPERDAVPSKEPARPRRSGWRHPLVIGTTAVALIAFGVALGAGIVQHTAPDPSAGLPMAGSRPLAPEPGTGPAPPPTGDAPRTLSPQVLQGMLGAARESLFAGRYSEAIAAYQAVLKRDPKNVDATTHLGLIVAIGGHADTALETFARALAIDPNYPPALLYRGQVLYDAKRDVQGAITSWEKFLAVSPQGEDRERVARMIAEAKAARPPK
jgi:tetratricopeptide (TPR) repeat protein